MHLCLKKIKKFNFILLAALKLYNESLPIETQHLLIYPLRRAVMIIEIVGCSSAAAYSNLLFN